jgi:hypothetical protein
MLGDALIADGFAQSILLCPLSVGGATVGEWAPGGTYHHRMIYGIERLREAGFHPSCVLWHQGEAMARAQTIMPTHFAPSLNRFAILIFERRLCRNCLVFCCAGVLSNH